DRTFNGTLPTAELIDKYVAERPVLLQRYDGHMALANTRALKLAGITADTPDPSGGVIYRKSGSKEPSGILRDNAMGLSEPPIPPASDGELAEAIRPALPELKANGVPSIQDMAGGGDDIPQRLFRHYQELARSGELTARIDLRWPLPDHE